jgi:hypothetical protein
MKRKVKQLPAFIPSEGLKDLIEKNTELDKPTLISRAAGRVERGTLNLLKMITFSRFGKTDDGELYFL